jgi:hypothetical protein
VFALAALAMVVFGMRKLEVAYGATVPAQAREVFVIGSLGAILLAAFVSYVDVIHRAHQRVRTATRAWRNALSGPRSSERCTFSKTTPSRAVAISMSPASSNPEVADMPERWRKIERGLWESADGQWRIANPCKLTTELRHRWLVTGSDPNSP